jgi:asparagine synthase (glutamine-hydrolysing)
LAGIAGIGSEGKQEQVERMLERIAHRGDSGSKIIESHGATLGAIWPQAEVEPAPYVLRKQAVWDGSRPPLPDRAALEQERDPFALTAATSEGMLLARDPLGVCPLYYGRTGEGDFCFASEVKALLEVTDDVQEFPPGTWYDSQEGFQAFFEVERGPDLSQDPERIASQLRLRLEQAISRRTDNDVMGCWLSGNLNSNSLAALARRHVGVLHTFAVGTPGAPDLESAQRGASFLQTKHHEMTISLDEVLAPLPAVIWHLESFDVPLVRSSVTRYLAAERAADYVGTMLYDEGADELLGGCPYLRELEPKDIADEMVESTQRLHNTALQRVDRSASSHGLVAYVPFLDLDVFEYAMSIPVDLKLRRNGEIIDKWILRRALTGVLPDDMLRPSNTTLWQGAGVGFLLALSSEDRITDEEFYRERVLPNGWTLKDKEALMYYRVFREHFGELEDLSWMGRTMGAPKTAIQGAGKELG